MARVKKSKRTPWCKYFRRGLDSDIMPNRLISRPVIGNRIKFYRFYKFPKKGLQSIDFLQEVRLLACL